MRDVSGGEDIKVSGSGIVNIGKDLISKGFSVAEHPDFTKTPTASGGTYTPGKGTVSRVHKGAGHYEGRGALMLRIGEDLFRILKQDIVLY